MVRCLVEMLKPYKGRIYGQESNSTTRRLVVMNLALCGIEADFGLEHADTFRRDLHPDLRADYVLANPPFNDSDWYRRDNDVRWQYGVPPKGIANFAWVQHFIHHLAPAGFAGFVLANGSMSSNQSGEGDIRKASIDARKLGTLIDCVHRELTDADLTKITTAYHAGRGEKNAGKYADLAGFCKSAPAAEIAAHGHVLTPGRYVGTEEVEDDGEPFEEKMPRLVAELHAQFAESAKLERVIKANLKGLGYGG